MLRARHVDVSFSLSNVGGHACCCFLHLNAWEGASESEKRAVVLVRGVVRVVQKLVIFVLQLRYACGKRRLIIALVKRYYTDVAYNPQKYENTPHRRVVGLFFHAIHFVQTMWKETPAKVVLGVNLELRLRGRT